ncbi:MAG: cell division protein ZipA C-terminal FtsZ-binding domain-containing protein [Zoogloeaceae bacterium]|jgi:FtsZ-interacting cell division protein ZipA|nr:cell division protein ZipA C-terminal FtsZ-binding domain-containing protein [Zoogloeaceae bacterium]
MNELQIGILILVVVVVLAVLAYNKWEEHKHRKTAERMFNTNDADKDADVLLRRPVRTAGAGGTGNAGSERREPGLNPEPVAESAKDAGTHFAGGGTPDEAACQPPPNDAAPLDELWAGIDAIATLDLVEAASAGEILTSWLEAPPRLQKLMRWVGLNENQGEWETLSLAREGRYRRLKAGLQLTDRQGPVGAGEFSRFAEIVRQVAKEHMAVATLPDRGQALEQAQQLEHFCYDADIQIGVNLVSRSTVFPGTKIRALAESAGMTLNADGMYIRRDDDAAILFYLQNASGEAFTAENLKTMGASGLVFLLDVPVTPRGQYVFKQMINLAKRFADTLDGVLVDDRRQPLSDVQLAQISQNYVVKPQARMDAAGLTAGGALAVRLFS